MAEPRKTLGLSDIDPTGELDIAPARTSAARRMGDAALAVGRGVIGVPEAAVGLADIATGGRAGRFLENPEGSIGFRPKQAKEFLSQYDSPAAKDAQWRFQNAEGIVGKAAEALSSPSLISNTLFESAPLIAGGGAAGRAAQMLAPRLTSRLGAGALGEGAVAAGSQAEQIRQETEDGLLTPKQSALAAGTGVAVGALGALGRSAASRLGVGDIDEMIAAGRLPANATASLPSRVARGVLSEGVFEELPQSLAETGLQNLALDRPIGEGMEESAVLGVLAGGAMGAGAGALSRRPPPAVAPPPAAAPTAPGTPPGLPYSPLAGTPIVFADGTVVLGSESEAGKRAELMARYGDLQPPTAPGTPPQPSAEQRLLGYNPAAGITTVFPDGSAVVGSDSQAGDEAVFNRRFQPQPADAPGGAPRVPPTSIAGTSAADLLAQPIDPVRAALPPSARMGINPSDGPLSAVAAMAVDSGTTATIQAQQLAAAAAEQAEKGASKAPAAAPSGGVATEAMAAQPPAAPPPAPAAPAPSPAAAAPAGGRSEAPPPVPQPTKGATDGQQEADEVARQEADADAAGQTSVLKSPPAAPPAPGPAASPAADADDTNQPPRAQPESQRRAETETPPAQAPAPARGDGAAAAPVSDEGGQRAAEAPAVSDEPDQADQEGMTLRQRIAQRIQRNREEEAARQQEGAAAPAATPAPAAAPTAEPENVSRGTRRRGTVGMMLEAGEVVLDQFGNETTPFPKFDTSTNRKAINAITAANRWLLSNALAAAQKRGDTFNERQFQAANWLNTSQADKDAAEQYLFGDVAPPVVPSILRPLAPDAQAAEPAAAPPAPTAEEFMRALAEARKELPAGFEIRAERDSVSLMEDGRYAVNGLGRNPAGVAEALRQAKLRAQQKTQLPVAPVVQEQSLPAKQAEEAENAASGAELQNQLYRNLLSIKDFASMTQEQAMDAAKTWLQGRNATTAVKGLALTKLVRTALKDAKSQAAELAKQANRDPAVYAGALNEARDNAGVTDPTLGQAFAVGFDHAMKGKPRSELTGENLAVMIEGYDAGVTWRQTDEGKAWYEGKPARKLANTGVDLRRHWELMREQMKSRQTSMEKAWADIERATARADLFAPFTGESMKPGMRALFMSLRDQTRTFREYLIDSENIRWYGDTGYGKNARADHIKNILDGTAYPRGDTEFESNEQHRIDWLRDKAEEYTTRVQSMLSVFEGLKTPNEVADAFTTAYFDDAAMDLYRKAAAIPWGQRNREQNLQAQVGENLLNPQGKALQAQQIINTDRPSKFVSELMRYTRGSAYIETLQEKLDNPDILPNKAKPLLPPRLDRVTRESLPAVREGNVTPQQFKERFGFADVGFGSWVGAKQDQDHLNYAWDAFSDLARHFGIPPSSIGLGRKVHFTVGALGHGKFAAHFQPEHPGPNGRVQVINLTNTRGDGTVYHEWAHALDHNLGGEWRYVRRMLLGILKAKVYTPQEWEGVADRFLFGTSYWQGEKRESMANRVDSARKAMTYYADSDRRQATSYKRHADALGADYWGNDEELFARAVEAWAGDTLGGVNNYLVNTAWSGDGAVTAEKGNRGTPYPQGEERKLFNEVLNTLAKSITVGGDGTPTVTLEAFQQNLPDSIKASFARWNELKTPEGMATYYREAQERKAQAEMSAQLEKEARARAEREELDRLAAEQIAQIQPAQPPAPPAMPDQAQGVLSDEELGAIFDQAAAELREGAVEQPQTPLPGQSRPPAPQTEAAAPPPAAPPVASDTRRTGDTPTAAELVAKAAKLGVKGADEALRGLSALFGKPGRLNSFPGGFDEDTYAQAKPHFKAALTAFQEAGKTLKDLFKLLIEQFGDGIKPYAIRFAKDESLGAQLSAQPTKSASAQVADFIYGRLMRNESTEWRELFAEADRAFGGTQAEGKYTPKDAYDAMEAGMNRYIMDNAGAFTPQRDGVDGAMYAVRALHHATQLLPTQTKRTSEQDEFQQFSTVPALAYAANWVANVNSGDLMLEPSAGIGGLAAFSQAAGAKVVLNELSQRRAAVLRDLFPTSKVFTENAEQIHNILPAEIVPTVVVMNPPFSATAGRVQGSRDTRVGAQHVEQALKRLAPGGRLVAIVGEGMNYDRPAFKDWWKKIGAQYDVRAVIPMDGKDYAKYGTTFDNAILVIDKQAPSGRPVVTTPATAYHELVVLLASIRNERPVPSIPAERADELARAADEQARVDALSAGRGDAAGAAAAGQPGAVGAGQPGAPEPDGVGSGGAAGRAQRARRNPPGAAQQPGAAGDRAGADAAAGGRAGDQRDGGSGTSEPVSGVAVESTSVQAGALTDSVFETYQPQRLKVAGAKPHPGPLVQSAAMASVLPPAPTYSPKLPKATVEDGLVSLAQIEAVVYAGQSHERMLPADVSGVSYRRGFFIGDGTGVGKGREISAIILDNLGHGRKKAVWISEKQGLFVDAKRDFSGVGGDASLLFNLKDKGKSGEPVNAGDGILFTTYSTLRKGLVLQDDEAEGRKYDSKAINELLPVGSKHTFTNVQGTEFAGTEVIEVNTRKKEMQLRLANGRQGTIRFSAIASIDGNSKWYKPKQKEGAGLSRVDQIVQWFGEDYDGVIAFDEAHNAGNAVKMKGERGESEPSQQAMAVIELQRRLPKARVVYVSATGATEVSNLSYATRLGLWGPNTPFASVQAFIAEMQAGGLAAMELVARDMKQAGVYLARSLSYDGVTYSRVDHQLTDIQRAMYDRMAEAWQVTLRNMEQALKITGAVDERGKGNSQAKAAAKAAYWGAQQRFFNQVITSMAMPSVLEAVQQDIDAGRAVVMQLVNTNEAAQERALARASEDGDVEELEELDLTPRQQLIEMVRKSFPVVQYEEQSDGEGKITRVPALDSKGEMIINREAQELRDKLIADLEKIAIPDDPLQSLLSTFGPSRVAEVTGRKERIYFKTNEDGETRLVQEKRGASSNRADADSFMDGKRDLLIFSDAGGTGFSFHADLTKKNQKRRAHYILQAGWRADKAVQGLGRSHRTNQASAPDVRLVSTDIPAQKRFLSAIARRLDQLGALTKGQRDTASQGMFSERDNLESIYATQAVRRLFEDALADRVKELDGVGRMEFFRQLGLEEIINDNGGINDSKMPNVRLFLNRLLSLKLDMQNRVFEAFLNRMDDAIVTAKERGTFDTGMQTIKALESNVMAEEVAYVDPATGAETHLVEFELTHPTVVYAFPQEVPEGAEFFYNSRSKRVFMRKDVGSHTLKDGSVVSRYSMRGTGGLTFKNQTEFGPNNFYEKIDEAKARELWQAELDAKPKTYKDTLTMVVGSMLPLWDRLKTEGESVKVARTQTVDGRRFLGMVVPKDAVNNVRKRLGMGNRFANMAPADVLARVLQGEIATLSNGWRIARSRVSGDLRIEILTSRSLTSDIIAELRSRGVIIERIEWRDRLFIPTGAAGIPVFQKVTEARPVVEIQSPKDQESLDAAAAQRARDDDRRIRFPDASQEKQAQAAEFARRLSARSENPITFRSVDPTKATSARSSEFAAVQMIAKRFFGLDINFVQFDGDPVFNGAVSGAAPRSIFVNVDSKRPLMAVLGHELLHQMAREQPGLYTNLSTRLARVMRNYDVYANRMDMKYQNLGIAPALDWVEELEADMMGDRFTEPAFWQQVAQGQPGLFQRIVQAIMRFLDGVSQRLTNERPFGTDLFLTDIQAARDAIAQAVREFSAAQVGAVADGIGGRDRMDAAEREQADAPDALSIADRVEQIRQFDVTSKPANTAAHYRGIGMQVLGRRQITELFSKELPELRQYNELVQRMDAEKNDTGAEADALANTWGGLDRATKVQGEELRLAELMHDATLNKIDPSKAYKPGDSKVLYNGLRRRWDALTPQAQQTYVKARDMYRDHFNKVREAIKDRIERSELSGAEKRAMLARMEGEFFGQIEGVYFPLARFGSYVIVVKNAAGEVVNVSRAETLNEADTTRRELMKVFDSSKGFRVGKVIKDAEFNAARDAVGKGFIKELFDTLDKSGVDEELRDSVAQLYLSSLPDLSWAKHGIHRKGTPGFSQDARRAFAQNMFHGARYLAKLRYSDQLQNALDDMQERIKAAETDPTYDSVKAQQVVDEMVKRHETLMNPRAHPLSTALTSVGFVFYLGISPAAAMVNMSQTALVAYPIMAAKWGYAKSSAALLKASAEVVKAKNDIAGVLRGEELEAYRRAVKDGTIDVTMAHDLAGIAQGEDAKVFWAMRPVMRWASFLFHHAERFNRQATFLASFRLAREAGASTDDAFEQAKKATYDGHFDYAASNRPRLMQGNVAKVVTLFKQYGQNMIYTLTRQAYLSMKGSSAEERTQARKILGGLLASHAAAAGVLGLPIVGPLLAAASFLGSDDDEPWDAEVALRNTMADAFGPTAADVMARGLSRLTPFDISSRVALDRLILPDVQEGLEGQRWAEAYMSAAIGPVGGIFINMVRGLQDVTNGDYQRGLESMLPVALRGPVRALRYGTEGEVDRSGVVIRDEVSSAGVAGQALGFAPTEVRRSTEGRQAIYNFDRALMRRRSVLMTHYAEAFMAGDQAGIAEARELIGKWNQKNPERRITPAQLMRSVRGRQTRMDRSEEGVYLPRNRQDAREAGRFANQE